MQRRRHSQQMKRRHGYFPFRALPPARPAAVAPDEHDCCVLCHRPTPYRAADPVSARQGYVEGAGQLCRQCWSEVQAFWRDA